jgi:hypothetical protein
LKSGALVRVPGSHAPGLCPTWQFRAAHNGGGCAVIFTDLPPATRPHAEAIARAAKHLNDLRERWQAARLES